ncbi:MAG: hypothetical protein HYY50_05185 [Candidatus Kerfeldbacteria bacterium]|nr:hypothetical protein [Candidatus Kerfeldbacteria bacterium]
MDFVIPNKQMFMRHYVELVGKDFLGCGRMLHITFRQKPCAHSFRFVALFHVKGLKAKQVRGTFYWSYFNETEQYFDVRVSDGTHEGEVFYHVLNEEILTTDPRIKAIA